MNTIKSHGKSVLRWGPIAIIGAILLLIGSVFWNKQILSLLSSPIFSLSHKFAGTSIETKNPYCRSLPKRDLPPLNTSTMKLWNYDADWHPSQWKNNFSYIPWRSDRIEVLANEDVVFVLNQSGAPQLKSGRNFPEATRGTWEVEVTLPEMKSGLVVAPLWLFNQQLKEEVDFEFAGTKSLDLSIHAYPDGIHKQTTVSVFKGMDFSLCTVNFKIVADIEEGWVEMYVEDELVHTFTKKQLGYFITGETKPVIEMWAARDDHKGFIHWLGRWRPLPEEESLSMVVHGFRYSNTVPSN